jgi:hypothetical protein
MAAKKWHPRPSFTGVRSWFDHEFIANDFETDLEHVLDCEEEDGAYVVKTDLTEH